MKYTKPFNKFVKLLDKRMLKGFHEYGDGSFDREPNDLLNEIQEELMDVCGWSVILFAKLENLKRRKK